MKLNEKQKYLLSMIGVAAATLLAVGLIGGWVALQTRAADGTPSLISGVVIAAIALLGWSFGYRLRERHRLHLPLWGALDEKQARLLAQYRNWRRSGKIGEPPSAEIAEASRSVAAAATGGLAGLSKRDRQRRAQVQAQQEKRRTKEEGQD